MFHCVKSVRIWSYSGPYFNTDHYGHFSRSVCNVNSILIFNELCLYRLMNLNHIKLGCAFTFMKCPAGAVS